MLYFKNYFTFELKSNKITVGYEEKIDIYKHLDLKNVDKNLISFTMSKSYKSMLSGNVFTSGNIDENISIKIEYNKKTLKFQIKVKNDDKNATVININKKRVNVCGKKKCELVKKINFRGLHAIVIKDDSYAIKFYDNKSNMIKEIKDVYMSNLKYNIYFENLEKDILDENLLIGLTAVDNENNLITLTDKKLSLPLKLELKNQYHIMDDVILKGNYCLDENLDFVLITGISYTEYIKKS